MNEQANEVRDPVAELEEACLRAELRARLMQEIAAWADFYEAVNDYFASRPPEKFDA